jgi:hypothetical protein
MVRSFHCCQHPSQSDLVYAACSDASVRLLDLSSSSQTVIPIVDHQEILRVAACTSSPDVVVACGGSNGTVTLWRSEGSHHKIACSHETQEEIYALHFISPTEILAGYDDCVARYDVETGAMLSGSLNQFASLNANVYGGLTRNKERKSFVFDASPYHDMVSVALSDGTLRVCGGGGRHASACVLSKDMAVTSCRFVDERQVLATSGNRVFGVDVRKLEAGPFMTWESQHSKVLFGARWLGSDGVLMWGGTSMEVMRAGKVEQMMDVKAAVLYVELVRRESCTAVVCGDGRYHHHHHDDHHCDEEVVGIKVVEAWPPS